MVKVIEGIVENHLAAVWAGKEDVTGIDYESWHYRYVGIEAARYPTEQQLTLDELWAS